MALQYLIPGILALWLVVLSVAFILLVKFFRHLVKGVKDYDLKAVLEKIQGLEEENRTNLEALAGEVRKINEEGRYHVQKVGLVRFNPFKEIGGDHSFSLALLNGSNTGVVITGLHTRERTRVYMKAIKEGKCEVELSEDEKKAILKAEKS